METIFLKLLNMSISAGWLILAVIFLRFLLKKARKSVRMVLWAMVGIRLICPFSLESALSLIPSAETAPQTIPYARQPAITSGIDLVDRAVNPVIAQNLTPISYAEAPPMLTITQVAGVVWAIGVGLMLLYVLVSWLQVRRKVTVAIEEEPGIFICDHIYTPFILGLFRPKIYLPSALEQAHVVYVTAHERAHIKRRDHWWKPLSFLLLAVYWFNPLIWVAYVLLCRDIELACDERVIRAFSPESKKNYSQALLACSMPRRAIAACPLAFGEVGVKARIKAVLRYQMPAVRATTVAVILCILVAVLFLTNPRTAVSENSIKTYGPHDDDPYPFPYETESPYIGTLPAFSEDQLPFLESSIDQFRYTVDRKVYQAVETPGDRAYTCTSYGWTLDLDQLQPTGKTEDGFIAFSHNDSDTFMLLVKQSEPDERIWLFGDGGVSLDIEELQLGDCYVYLDDHLLEEPSDLALLWDYHTNPARTSASVLIENEGGNLDPEIAKILAPYVRIYDGVWEFHTVTLVTKACPAIYYTIRYNIGISPNGCLCIENACNGQLLEIMTLSPDELTQIGWSGISTTED